MQSISDNPVKIFLNLDLNSDNLFISVKPGLSEWTITTKKADECANLSKTMKTQTQIFNLLIKKLRSEPMISGVTSDRRKEWKINQKVNVIFSDIFKRAASLEDLGKARLEVANALEIHMKCHFFQEERISCQEELKKPFSEVLPTFNIEESYPIKEEKSLSSSKESNSSSKEEEKSLFSSFRRSKIRRSVSEGKPCSKSVSMKTSQSSPTITRTTDIIHQSIPELLEEEQETHCIQLLTPNELRSCLFAWREKSEKEIPYQAIYKTMISDPISESAYIKIRQLGIYRNRYLASQGICQILNMILNSPYEKMSEDYIRQIARLEICGSNNHILWKYVEDNSPVEKNEQEKFEYLSNQFSLFLKTMLKKGCRNGSSDTFFQTQLNCWEAIVKGTVNDSESQTTLFETALRNYWRLIQEEAEIGGKKMIFSEIKDLYHLISLLSVSRQSLYVSPVQSLICLFPEYKLKMRKGHFPIRYNFGNMGDVSIETSRILELENEKYKSIDSLNVTVKAFCFLADSIKWTSVIQLEVVPKSSVQKDLLRKMFKVLTNYGFEVIIRE